MQQSYYPFQLGTPSYTPASPQPDTWTCNLQEAGTLPEQLQVFPWFSQRVLARCSDNSITHHDLLKLLPADRYVPPAAFAASILHHNLCLSAYIGACCVLLVLHVQMYRVVCLGVVSLQVVSLQVHLSICQPLHN